MTFYRTESVFEDCRGHYPVTDSELIVVEGESAARSVAAIRNQANQAVFSLQGKPLNAWRATPKKVFENSFFSRLSQISGIDLLDAGKTQVQLQRPSPEQAKASLVTRRFDRIVLLFDPDADGIHCCALTLMFLLRWMRPTLDAGMVHIARAPMFIQSSTDSDGVIQQEYAYSREHLLSIQNRIQADGALADRAIHVRGLGSLNPEQLRACCLEPSSRLLEPQSVRSAQLAVEVFGA